MSMQQKQHLLNQFVLMVEIKVNQYLNLLALLFSQIKLHQLRVVVLKLTTYSFKVTQQSLGNIQLGFQHQQMLEHSDIIFDETPSQGEYVGWVYTNDKDWRRFGSPISLEKNQDKYIFDKVGIGTTTLSGSMFRVGAGSTLVAIDAGIVTATAGVNVGSGITLCHMVEHSCWYCHGDRFTGSGANLTNLNVSAAGWTQVDTTLR